MEAVAASVIAVLGTLFGAALTHAFQRRTALRSEEFARQERLRQERLDAYSTLGGALMNYRRAVLDRWYAAHRERPEDEQTALAQESRLQRTTAQEALFRAELLTDDPALTAAGQHVLVQISEIRHAPSHDEVKQRRNDTHTLIHELITSSKKHVSATPPAPVTPARRVNTP
ncbi:hypothetical protein G3I40_12800 [Streptomyces sp. SID14478]|uniref:hypothetical protein n=1 Tax=Streptomyces sp. SID14478 TaxID=2706073 RepID=UPI0013D9E304|nr:hypothetical protein [Streptomyces sp. SID14478]NEB76091.1 hypothetical protein [Streptomyces sp. SID14478]